MSKTMVMMACAVIMVAVVPAMAQTDITNPGNAIIGIPNDNDWPGAETPPLSIDNVVTTKYLHFKGETQPTGIAVTPSGSGIVTALRLTTANDAEPRDPASYQLSGSNDPVGVPADLANINWTLISEGPLSLPSDRLTTMAAPVVFPNFTAYTHYRLMFPTVKDSANANSMQIAEIELMTAPAGGWPPSVDAGAPQLIIMPADTATMAPTVIDVDTPEEQLTYQWALRSAPAGGSVNFNGTDTQTDAQVTFSQVGGEYVLELSVTDADDNDSNDVVTIRVWDPAVDNVMVAHWDFNEGSGNVANDSTVMSTKGVNGKGEDDGELTSYKAEILQALTPPQDDPSYDPNWVTGWISSETPNTALDFRDFGFVKVIPDPDSLDPNMTNMAWQISISAWMNAQDWVGNRRIMQKGLSDNQYRLLAEGGNLRFHLANVGTLDAPLPSAGTWHHVVATYDYSTMKIYVDGTERASLAASGLIGQTGDPLYIGAKSEAVNPVSYPGDYYKGQLDDIRLYSYALTADEVLALAVMGDNAPPTVSVVDPEDLVLSVTNYIQMDATAEDINDDTINYEWRATGPAAVTFDPSANVEDPKAVFTEAGTYTLRLTVDDGQAGLGDDIFAEVVVEVTNPGCDVVIELGYGMASDINEDCYVNLLDFAALAADWLECNNPLDDDCPNPFQQ